MNMCVQYEFEVSCSIYYVALAVDGETPLLLFFRARRFWFPSECGFFGDVSTGTHYSRLGIIPMHCLKAWISIVENAHLHFDT